jgi:DNA polymerase III delta subunit
MTVDTTDRTIRTQIAKARKKLIAVAEEHSETKWWGVRELAAQARNGWSSAVIDLALRELVDEEVFDQGSDLRVRLVRTQT